jgi:hypothetical protein
LSLGIGLDDIGRIDENKITTILSKKSSAQLFY